MLQITITGKFGTAGKKIALLHSFIDAVDAVDAIMKYRYERNIISGAEFYRKLDEIETNNKEVTR